MGWEALAISLALAAESVARDRAALAILAGITAAAVAIVAWRLARRGG